MKLYYSRVPGGNFGDDLNPWLWPKLFPRPVSHYYDDQTLFLGIGTILRKRIPEAPEKLVFGSGFGYEAPPTINDKYKFYCVRGPLTASCLGLDPNLVISDSAVLLRKLISPSDKIRYAAAFMPHHNTPKEDNWKELCESIEVKYIDPRDPVEDTLETIRSSAVIITESMHGAIVADTLRVPWIPVRTRPGVYEFKWHDWAMSLEIEHKFELLTPIWDRYIPNKGRVPLLIKEGYSKSLAKNIARNRLKWLVKFGKPRLSKDIVFENVYQRILERFSLLTEELEKSVFTR